MVEKLKSLREDTLVYELSWVVSEAGITAIEPNLKKMEDKYGRVKLMIVLNAKGETLSALLEEFEVSIRHWNKISKIAYVGDKKWWKPLVAVDNVFTKIKEKYFDLNDLDEAWKWLGEP